MENEIINIAIVDDHTLFRSGLASLLSEFDEINVAFEATNGIDLQEKIINYPNTQLVLMDINMPEVDGIEGLKIIKTHNPAIKVLMQTAYDDSEKIFTSIKNGASGYILKNDKPQRILQAIEEVVEGGAAMNPAIAQKVLDYFKPIEKKSPLSPKETEVLSQLAEGLSYKMVADKLGVSYTTINTHTKRIYEKLHISSLGEAIAYYYKNLL